MAAELESRCPICLDSWQEATYVVPCLHQFCHPCITRWAETKPECPLCKGVISSIVHSVRADDDFKELVITPPPAAQPPATLSPPTAPLGGFHDYDWASIFWDYPSVFQALLPWLQEELEQLFEDVEEVTAVQGRIMIGLHCYGLDGEALTRMLWVATSRQMRSFVQRLMAAVVRLCSGEAQRQMALAAARATEEREGSPAVAPSPAASPGASSAPSSTDLQGGPSSAPSAPVPTHREHEETREVQEEAMATGRTPSPGASSASSSTDLRGGPSSALFASVPTHREHEEPREVQEEAMTTGRTPSPWVSSASSSTDLRGGPSSAPSAPVPTHGVQEERREHPEEAVAGPSTQSRSSQRCPGRPRRAPKRRAGNPDGTSQPRKKAPRRQ